MDKNHGTFFLLPLGLPVAGISTDKGLTYTARANGTHGKYGGNCPSVTSQFELLSGLKKRTSHTQHTWTANRMYGPGRAKEE